MSIRSEQSVWGVTRRGFLSAAAGGAVAGVLGAGRTAMGAEGKWQMRLSTSSIHYVHVPIEQVCERLGRLGFEGIDIWSAFQKCPHLDDVQKRLGADGLKEVLAKNKLKLFSFSVYAGGYARYAELLGKMGGGVAVQGSASPCKPGELTARMRAFIESRKPLLELAEKHNSCLAIENHGHALLDTVDSMKAFVDLNQSPRLGIALAPYHVQGPKASVPAAIEACGKQLLYFYAWQRSGGMGQLPGHGPADCTPWIAALAKVGYKGYVNPFMHGHPEPDAMDAALAKSRGYLLECYRKAVKA